MKKIIFSFLIILSFAVSLHAMEKGLNEPISDKDSDVVQINDILQTDKGDKITRICTRRGNNLIQIIFTSYNGFAGLTPDEIAAHLQTCKKSTELTHKVTQS